MTTDPSSPQAYGNKQAQLHKCVFCDVDLLPADRGSEEHVFLSSLGGRLKTTRAICAKCNNAFATTETDNADTELSAFFEGPRNFLNIMSGRKDPPPTIENIYDPVSGNYYDLAPGMTPVPRKLWIPSKAAISAVTKVDLIAGNIKEANRAGEILKLRKIEVQELVAFAKSHRLGRMNYQMRLNKNPAYRSVAKTAIVAAVVLFGNEAVRKKASAEVRSAARYGKDVRQFVGAALAPGWLHFINDRAHPDSPGAVASGFEHSAVFADVDGCWMAYLQFFGGFRFCVHLGVASGLPIRCLMINPRSPVHARLNVDIGIPPTISNAACIAAQHDTSILAEITTAMSRILEACYAEGAHIQDEIRLKELADALNAAGDDEAARAQVMVKHSRKIATVDAGGIWTEPVDITDT